MTKQSARPGRRNERTGGIASRVRGTVGPDKVDPAVLARGSLGRVDYADHFVLAHEAASRGTPEQWARAMFGDTPDLIERILWSGILGLRLQAGRSTETIAGWRIVARDDDGISLAATSPTMAAVLVVRASASALELATLCRYAGSRRPAVWVPTAFIHRRLVPVLLRSTARAMAAR